MAGGVLPVLKHLPGHGRATADSHHGFRSSRPPRPLEATDFAAFRPLAELPLGMTAHVVFTPSILSRRPRLRSLWSGK